MKEPVIEVITSLGPLRITCLHVCGEFMGLKLETDHAVEFKDRMVQFAIGLDMETKRAINRASLLIGAGPKCGEYLAEIIELLDGVAVSAIEQYGDTFFPKVKKYAAWKEIQRTKEQIQRLQNEMKDAEEKLLKMEAEFVEWGGITCPLLKK
ncbi:MAG: hypothetical protein WC511_02010 [Candidatus Pacearchaeota archaeon]